MGEEGSLSFGHLVLVNKGNREQAASLLLLSFVGWLVGLGAFCACRRLQLHLNYCEALLFVLLCLLRCPDRWKDERASFDRSKGGENETKKKGERERASCTAPASLHIRRAFSEPGQVGLSRQAGRQQVGQ